MHSCKECGQLFYYPLKGRKGRKPTFCSSLCGNRHRTTPATAKYCPICGVKLARNTAERCSRCRTAHNWAKRLESGWSAPVRVRYCKECFHAFIAEDKMMHKKYCSDTCKNRQRYRVQGARKRRKYGAHAHRSRARRYGGDYSAVNRQEVFKRDGYVCHLCGRITRPDDGPNTERYPTIDHLVPMSLGGDHSYKNVKTACFGCNTRRGNRPL